MTLSSVVSLALLGWFFAPSTPSYGDSARCAALRNSPLEEPEWHARECAPQTRTHPSNPAAVMVAGDLAYQFNMRSASPVSNPTSVQTFVLPNAATSTVLGPQTRKLFALDFDDVTKTLYAIDNATYEFGSVDKATGAFTTLGSVAGLPAGHVITGLSIDPRNSALYLSSTDTLVSLLSSFNKTSFLATSIGEIGFEQIIDIAVNRQGEVYGHDIVQDVLVRIDLATGTGISLGSTGYDANFAQGMDFDNSDGTLYGWLYLGGGVAHLVTFNLATGAASIVGTPGAGEYEGAIPDLDLIFRDGFEVSP